MQPTVHIGEEILKELKAQERSVAWLATKINRDRSNFNRQLKNPHLHSELLYRISSVLGVDFFACYSHQLSVEIQSKIHHKSVVNHTGICKKNSHI